MSRALSPFPPDVGLDISEAIRLIQTVEEEEKERAERSVYDDITVDIILSRGYITPVFPPTFSSSFLLLSSPLLRISIIVSILLYYYINIIH